MDEQNTVAAAATEETQTQSAAPAATATGADTAPDVKAASEKEAGTARAAAPEANAAPDAKPAADAAKDDKAAPAAKAAETAATDAKAEPNGKATSEAEAGTARAREIAALQQRLAESELRSAAALAGVPREKVPYVARMADVSGINPADKDAADRYAKAVERVLSDVPELRGGSAPSGAAPAGTGGAGSPEIHRARRR